MNHIFVNIYYSFCKTFQFMNVKIIQDGYRWI